jgi:dTDP-4-amino-4,6-dideoxygalactose transaminase
MHESLRPAIRRELETVLSLDNDAALFEYQYKGEKEIGRFLGGRHAIGVSSGTAALQFALTGIGIGTGDEVITSAHTYVATLLAISATGATPVLVDVQEDTMLMDADRITERITPRTKAIVPVHLYGQMADLKKISAVARKHELHIIEDACQAHLARFDGRVPGSESDAACYSFFPSKNLGGAGNGGMVVTRDKRLLRTIEELRNPSSDSPHLLKSHRTPAFSSGYA